MNVTPVFRCQGTVHTVQERTVQPSPAVADERDEQGRLVKRGREARPGYDVFDVTVHTKDGGYALVLLRADGVEHLAGEVPSKGSDVDWPIRCYVSWQGPEGRRYTVPGFSVALDVLADEAKSAKSSTSPVTRVS